MGHFTPAFRLLGRYNLLALSVRRLSRPSTRSAATMSPGNRSAPSIPVSAAEAVKEETHLIVGGLKIVDRWFQVPVDYSCPDGEKIRVFARSAINNKDNDGGVTGGKQPICVYLQGGPGFECSPPKSHPLTEFYLGKGYQMLYIDQRGTGLSSPIDADVWMKGCTVAEKVQRLKMLRADNIVRDCEAIRKTMLDDKEKEEERKWTVHGQSFGGFCAVTYLSFYPEGLKEVFTTGGMPPLVNNPDAVYDRTYRKLQERNAVYYRKYPQDVKAVRRIVAYLKRDPVVLPSGGTLTEGRFRDLGLAFGGHGGIDTIHRIVQRAVNDLDCYDGFTYKLKQMIESQQSFDVNPIYALLHEACYCQGEPSGWSAARRLPPSLQSSSDEDPILFTGEMIYPYMFTDYSELSKFHELADPLAYEKAWPALYDVDQLKRNEVPVFAANFIDDMYVAYDLSRETVATIQGARSFDTNVLHHNAVRAKTWAVMGELWKLRSGEVD